jgi:hypothetical protein
MTDKELMELERIARANIARSEVESLIKELLRCRAALRWIEEINYLDDDKSMLLIDAIKVAREALGGAE